MVSNKVNVIFSLAVRMAVCAKPIAPLWLGLAALVAVAGCAPQEAEFDDLASVSPASIRSQLVELRGDAATNGKLNWIREGRLSPRGDVLRNALAWSEIRGVCSNDYGVTRIDDRLAQGGTENLAAADALLTEGLARYATEVGGRDAGDTGALVTTALNAEDFGRFLGELVPTDPAYRRLSSALGLYIALAHSGGWQPIPEGTSLKQGMTRSEVRSLRRRLIMTGDLTTGDIQSPVFDADLDAAVRRYQARNGLAVDGIVGKETRAALNVPAELRATIIAQNLCRYPNILAKQTGTAIVVNVPGAELQFFRDGQLHFRKRVIVGRADWPTPIISDAIRGIEVNPYWNIPPRIARLEVIPKIIEDPGYLKSRGIRVLSVGGESPRELDAASINWASARSGTLPIRLRQDPGPKNPMGLVKFQLSNPQHVFLHDTSAPQLFEREKRSLSHGCVRVEDAVELAKLILDSHAQSPSITLEQAFEAGKPVTIRLKEPVPVHLVAISAWVDADGTVQFRIDPTRDLPEESCIASVNTVSANN